ncbi:MAG: rpoD2 [Oscillospiraceae bacterium]|nr:rpoD2 [Oscillospiraceae bacterium]
MPDTLLRTDKDVTEIYNQHVNTVYKVCFMFMKNIPDTEDAVQSTFIKLMEYKGAFTDDEHKKAWLIVTASNICRNHLRHWWRKTVDINTLIDDAGVKDAVVDETLRQVLELPPKYKTAVYLYYYEGYSTVEIAKMFQKKESTVRSHLHTGRKLLKINLEGEQDE